MPSPLQDLAERGELAIGEKIPLDGPFHLERLRSGDYIVGRPFIRLPALEAMAISCHHSLAEAIDHLYAALIAAGEV